MKYRLRLEKMPDIYIIDDPSLNAFATGRDPNHAAVSIHFRSVAETEPG